VTGAAAEAIANVRFVADSATFESLPEIRELAKKFETKFGESTTGSPKPRPRSGDFVDYAMQILAIIYKNSKE
jgi:hypothetical protein